MQNPNTNIGDTATVLVDTAAHATDQAIRTSRRVANKTLDHVAETIDDARLQTDKALNRLAGDAERLMRRGVDAVRDGSQQLRGHAVRASGSTVAYVKDEPVKAILIAAAAGAALMALITLGSRAGRTRD